VKVPRASTEQLFKMQSICRPTGRGTGCGFSALQMNQSLAGCLYFAQTSGLSVIFSPTSSPIGPSGQLGQALELAHKPPQDFPSRMSEEREANYGTFLPLLSRQFPVGGPARTWQWRPPPATGGRPKAIDRLDRFRATSEAALVELPPRRKSSSRQLAGPKWPRTLETKAEGVGWALIVRRLAGWAEWRAASGEQQAASSKRREARG